MKLYELSKGDKFKIPDYEDIFVFHNIDGMYSLCFVEGEIVHLSASTPVYKIEEPFNG